MTRPVNPVRVAILAAGLTERQRETLCALPIDGPFVPMNVGHDYQTIRALRFERAIEVSGPVQLGVQAYLPHVVTPLGVQLRLAAEAMR